MVSGNRSKYVTFPHLQILDTVAEIQERHDAVRDLERKLLELQQVMPFSFLFFFGISSSM